MSHSSINISNLFFFFFKNLSKYVPHAKACRPQYRMRHDSHYIDGLESRRRPGRSEPTTTALAFPTSIPVTFALQDMSQELEGVASCFNLVAARSRPLRERLGLALARVGVQRNMRAFQALRILLEDAQRPRWRRSH